MPDLSRIVRASLLVYRLVLKAYPREFRSEFGEEMLAVFADQMVDAMQKNGLCGIILTWFRVSGDFCCSVFHQHSLVVKGRLMMLPKTSVKAFTAGACTTLVVAGMTAAAVATFQARRAELLMQEALSAEAAIKQSRDSDMMDPAAQPISWNGSLDDFPDGAKLSEPQTFTFNGPGGPVTVEVPVVTWQTKATGQLR